jgi:SagB-type dehydrogenase family enzyme
MSATIPVLPVFYRLQDDTHMRERGDTIVVVSACCQVTISHLSPPVRHVLMELAHTACSACWINETLLQEHETGRLTTFYRYLCCLLRHRMATIGAGEQHTAGALATLIPLSSYFRHVWVTIGQDHCYRLSRFVYLRRDEDACYLESPLAHARLRLEQALAAKIVYLLCRPVTAGELVCAAPAEDQKQVMGLLTLLLMGNFASLTTAEGQPSIESDEMSRHWDFHDLLFHSRSRVGRHANELGGTYRFLSTIPPPPVVKQASGSATIALFRPDLEQLRTQDPALTAVLEERTSMREYGRAPLTVAQLGEFLYRVARVKKICDGGETGAYTQRPYPGAGASYEMELYLTIEQCEGLAAGFYWYNPLEHTLSLLHAPNHETRQLLFDANLAMGGPGRPQVLITLAARFQRVSWKYQSLAYSLILKDVGVIYATMYLVATAMHLAPCALGAGDSDLFLHLSGTDYLAETSVGEFMLGSQPAPEE